MITIEQVREAISAAGVDCDSAALDVNETFESIGFDSLDIYNIIIEIQGVVGVEVPDSDIEKLQSIDSIVDYFSKR